MDRPRSETVTLATYRLDRDPGPTVGDDEVIIEEPLTVRFDGVTVMTTMRTPGHDYELAVGWCQTEGLLDGATLRGVRHCDEGIAPGAAGNVVAVESAGAAAPTPRLTLSTTSCGICGTDALDQIGTRLHPLPLAAPIDPAVLLDVCAAAVDHQGLFATTGAVHAAAAFNREGAILVSREDVGRHNAVDKIVGRLYLDGVLPATGLGLFVSGRASFELVHKAWSGGFSHMVAIGAPTALAVETARRAGLHLAGFVRGRRLNIYAPAARRPTLGP